MERMEVRVLYQNVGRGGDATHIFLQTAVELGAVIAVTAGERGRRKQQPGYEIAYESDDIVVYRIRGSLVTVRGQGNSALAEGDMAIAYLRPKLNRNIARSRLREMERRGASTFMGDFNCHGHGKDRMLQEWTEEEELMDIGTAEYTHRWGAHRCTIDRILTRGGARP